MFRIGASAGTTTAIVINRLTANATSATQPLGCEQWQQSFGENVWRGRHLVTDEQQQPQIIDSKPIDVVDTFAIDTATTTQSTCPIHLQSGEHNFVARQSKWWVNLQFLFKFYLLDWNISSQLIFMILETTKKQSLSIDIIISFTSQ